MEAPSAPDTTRLPTGNLVVSGSDGDTIAGKGTELLAGRSYILAVEPAVADEVVALFRG